MRLRYDTSVSADAEPLILVGAAEMRVEIHLRQERDGSASLLAFSGQTTGRPQKTLQQGPYQTLDQAIAAKRAIAAQLKDAGFVQREQHPVWSLDAQRDINSQRAEKQLSAVDYRFDPKDVFLDW